MRHAPVLVLGMAIAALVSAGAVLAFQKNDPPTRGKTVVASVLGYEQPRLRREQWAATDRPGTEQCPASARNGAELELRDRTGDLLAGQQVDRLRPLRCHRR
jgi:hypothetical protein